MHGYLIVVEHYLFHDANSLPSSKLEENNEFVSAYFCVFNGSYCLLSLNIFCNARYKMLTISLLFIVEDMNVWCLLVQIFKQTNMYFLL